MSLSKITHAKLRLCHRQKFLSGVVMALSEVPNEAIPLGTPIGVDDKWRLHYKPSWVEEQPLEVVSCIIFHEALHLWLKHHKRAAGYNLQPGGAEWMMMNIAMDCVVYELLRDSGETDIPPEHQTPEMHGLPPGLAWDEYFSMLMQKHQQEQEQQQNQPQPQEQQGGSSQEQPQDGQGEPQQGQGDSDSQDGAEGQDGPQGDAQGDSDGGQPGDDGGDGQGGAEGQGDGQPGDDVDWSQFGGSAADGIPRPWEQEADQDLTAPQGLPHAMQEQIIRQAAEEFVRSCGEGSGGQALEYARQIVQPRIDPRRVFLCAVRDAIDMLPGHQEPSYRRPSRRPATDPSIVRPSTWDVSPDFLIIVDTSGSMGQDDIALALGLIRRVVASYRLQGVRIVAGDAEIGMEEYIHDPEQLLQLVGGGGTNMGRILEQSLAAARKKPDIAVVITDGETPWCDDPGIPVVVALTQDESQYHRYKVPAWARKVRLNA